MKALCTYLTDPFVIFYTIFYLFFYIIMVRKEKFNPIFPVFVFMIYGVGFVTVAFFTTRNINEPDPVPIHDAKKELILIGISLLLILVYLVFAKGFLDKFDEPIKSILVLGSKVLFFVGIPSVLMILVMEYKISELFSSLKLTQEDLPPLVLLSIFSILFNIILGQEFQNLKNSKFASWQIIIGIIITFLWLVIEVGLVEEFFFRVLLQERLTVYLNSQTGGISIMAIIFGLVHAPGIYLGRADIDILGQKPSFLLSVGYTIVVISIISFFFGVIWSRTHNLLMLMLIHASFDLIPKLGKIIEVFLS